MNAIFELVWRKWDKKFSELEELAGAPRRGNPAPEAAGDSIEVRYLNDIIKQNIGEMKDLKLKQAELTVEHEKLGRKLGETAKLLGEARSLAESLRRENAFLKCETQLNPERVKELCERAEVYEKKLHLKEAEIGRLYAKIQVYEEEKRGLSGELEKARADNRMLRVRKVFGGRAKKNLNGWLSKPLIEVKL
jgi:chromosome segregation ATPase